MSTGGIPRRRLQFWMVVGLWATARKRYPLKDVAAAGGWKDTATLQNAYTHSDSRTRLAVVNGD